MKNLINLKDFKETALKIAINKNKNRTGEHKYSKENIINAINYLCKKGLSYNTRKCNISLGNEVVGWYTNGEKITYTNEIEVIKWELIPFILNEAYRFKYGYNRAV